MKLAVPFFGGTSIGTGTILICLELKLQGFGGYVVRYAPRYKNLEPTGITLHKELRIYSGSLFGSIDTTITLVGIQSFPLFRKSYLYIRVIRKVRRLGGENGQFRHNRPSNPYLGMKISQKEITGTQTSCSTNFGGKLSFILCFLFPGAPALLLHIFSVIVPVQLLQLLSNLVH